MELSIHTKRRLIRSRLFTIHLYRNLLKAAWLFFPAILFLLLAYGIFWYVPQGKDIISIALEKPSGSHKSIISWPYVFFILGLVFWIYSTWYTTRIVSKAKDFQEPNNDPIWAEITLETPRILAFMGMSIVILAIANLPRAVFNSLPDFFILQTAERSVQPMLSLNLCNWLLILSLPLYLFVHYLWTSLLKRIRQTSSDWHKSIKRLNLLIYIFFTIGFFVIIRMQDPRVLVPYLILLQGGLVLLMILRHELDQAKKKDGLLEKIHNPLHANLKSSITKKLRHVVFDDEDLSYYRAFKWISLIAIITYVLAIKYINVASFITSFPFMLLAFGVLLLVGNFISLISVLYRFNFHLILFILAMALGHFTTWTESYKAELIAREPGTSRFDRRQNLREYFIQWINDPSRREELNKCEHDHTRYPVYFVMANGGASRSGYWTALILTGLESSTDGWFSQHLFCLSGASGGSLGTSTFFTLLKEKKESLINNAGMVDAADKFLQSDFLTFTISHLLGPDIFSHFVPFLNRLTLDRATALAHSIEEAPGGNRRDKHLYHRFAQGFSNFITQEGTPYPLPILCINTTRMQNGRPAVISNIRIKETGVMNNYFNNRIDLLDLLDSSSDIKLSTAVVLGASFPYLSPAGRVDDFITDSTSTGKNYFVDGGYFDNSGAGVVNEMIIAINNMLNDPNDSLSRYKDRFDFRVIHISNTDPKSLKKERINPVMNDLLSPIRTIMGSYGTQTTINDQRLKNFLSALYKDTTHYVNIDLYKNNFKIKYSMNWVISHYQLKLMKMISLPRSDYLKEIKFMNDSLRKNTSPVARR